MKNKRQNAIKEIIANHDVETQGELADRLMQSGYKVTQATVSRDIKELRLVKVLTEHGSYKYASGEQNNKREDGVPIRVFTDTVRSIDLAGSIVVVHTLSGSANAAAEALDSQHFAEIAGTIAGDNTIFIAIKEGYHGNDLVKKLRKLAK
ncbi:MAG: arginine repressor [Clostridiales bacterium]|nr:arginine repressor [Clostridiales bacterium]